MKNQTSETEIFANCFSDRGNFKNLSNSDKAKAKNGLPSKFLN